MLKNMLLTAMLVGMFMMGPVYIPAPAIPRERIVFFTDASFGARSGGGKRLRNHYRKS